MSKCQNPEIREILPDLLSGNISESERSIVEEHLLLCNECMQESEILRAVRAIRPVVKSVDVDMIVAAINADVKNRKVVSIESRSRKTTSTFLQIAAALTIVVGGTYAFQQLGKTGLVDAAHLEAVSNEGSLIGASPYAPDRVPIIAVASLAPSVIPIQELSDYSEEELMFLLEQLEAWDGTPEVEELMIDLPSSSSDSSLEEML